MNEVEIANYRRRRLIDAINHVSHGDRSAFGRRLGYQNGAFIRQMLSGNRAISEKTINKIESLPGMHGWFRPESDQLTRRGSANIESLESKLSADITRRYASKGDAAKRVIELVLREHHDPMPVWATKPLISAVDTALAVAEMTLGPVTERPKQARR